MGRAGGNSRGGQRIDVHKDTADLIASKGGIAGTPVPQAGGRAGPPQALAPRRRHARRELARSGFRAGQFVILELLA